MIKELDSLLNGCLIFLVVIVKQLSVTTRTIIQIVRKRVTCVQSIYKKFSKFFVSDYWQKRMEKVLEAAIALRYELVDKSLIRKMRARILTEKRTK